MLEQFSIHGNGSGSRSEYALTMGHAADSRVLGAACTAADKVRVRAVEVGLDSGASLCQVSHYHISFLEPKVGYADSYSREWKQAVPFRRELWGGTVGTRAGARTCFITSRCVGTASKRN